jgi:hypothetical protein
LSDEWPKRYVVRGGTFAGLGWPSAVLAERPFRRVGRDAWGRASSISGGTAVGMALLGSEHYYRQMIEYIDEVVIWVS